MDAESYTDLIPLIFLGVVFFTVAISALYWSAKKGQLRDFDKQSKTIFTEEEPEGELSDSFPKKEIRKKK
ncbi:MAG: cbb3-type cytochrome oxidase assembly protein CcoS [Puniceicoccaceae bacterium]|nr:MAG: cbb3-type cytochrome oxidase assembly protein CcoS [Puniceicoccaceae bacterium]